MQVISQQLADFFYHCLTLLKHYKKYQQKMPELPKIILATSPTILVGQCSAAQDGLLSF